MIQSIKKTILMFCLTWLIATVSNAQDVEMSRYAVEKRDQTRAMAESLTNKPPAILWSFFEAVRVDDWQTATNLGATLEKDSGRYARPGDKPSAPQLTQIWAPISEVWGAYEQFHNWDKKWLHRFGDEIISSIPNGSIYFGGTDPGRYIVSVLQGKNSPFFTLTQNQMVDTSYLDYMNRCYPKKIYLPDSNDVESAISEYKADAEKRMKAGKLKPGEAVREVDGRVQISGQVAVMAVNGLIVKIVSDKNRDCQIFIEESFVLDWMFPYLTPHGLIMELHHQPLAAISTMDVAKDHDYWKKFTGELVGDWVSEKTSVREICEFGEKTYLRKDYSGFNGDLPFAKNTDEQKTFSKLRSSIAGVYAWRRDHARDNEEKTRMSEAADLAFKQALACCPSSPETVFRYVQFLEETKRPDDAILVAKTASLLQPNDTYVANLLRSVEKAN